MAAVYTITDENSYVLSYDSPLHFKGYGNYDGLLSGVKHLVHHVTKPIKKLSHSTVGKIGLAATAIFVTPYIANALGASGLASAASSAAGKVVSFAEEAAAATGSFLSSSAGKTALVLGANYWLGQQQAKAQYEYQKELLEEQEVAQIEAQQKALEAQLEAQRQALANQLEYYKQLAELKKQQQQSYRTASMTSYPQMPIGTPIDKKKLLLLGATALLLTIILLRK